MDNNKLVDIRSRSACSSFVSNIFIEGMFMLCIYRKSMEHKATQEKRDREREHVDDVKKKEKEKTVKEELTKQRTEKEIKKIESVTVKKSEPSVSPKKLRTASLPITRHTVNSNLLNLKYGLS